MNEMLFLLEPLEFATRIAGKLNATISFMIPVMNTCLNKLQQYRKAHLKRWTHVFQRLGLWTKVTNVSQRFDSIEINKVTAVACILDPRFKEAFFKSERNVNSAIYDLEKMLKNVKFEDTEHQRMDMFEKLQSQLNKDKEKEFLNVEQ